MQMRSESLAGLSPDARTGSDLELGGATPVGFEKAKVLLVDDSRLIRMGLRRSLEEIGIKDIVKPGTGAKPSKPWYASTLT